MKKLLSLILAAIMVCGTLMITDVTSLAAEPEAIQSVSIAVPKVPTKGQIVSPVSDITVSGQEPYTVESAEWSAWMADTSDDLDVANPCVVGGQYHLEVVLVAKTGYEFADNCEFTVVGEDVPNGFVNKQSNSKIEVNIDWTVAPERIPNVDVTLLNAEQGKTTSDLQATVPSGAKYSVKEILVYKYDEANDVFDLYTGAFEKGQRYSVQIDLVCNDKEYGFVQPSVKLNGESANWGSSGHYDLQIQYEFNTSDKITEVEMSGVPKAEKGKSPVVTGVSVPQNAEYKVLEVKWYDEDTGNELQAGDKFEDGKAYNLEVTLKANKGFVFDNEKLFVDGKEKDQWWYSDATLTYMQRFSFKKQIKAISVTGLTKPVAGQQPDKDVTITGEGIDAANYYVIWWDDETGNEITGTFPNKGLLRLSIEITPLGGWEFADEMDVTLNGEKVAYYGDHIYAEIVKTYSIGYETIKKVELTVEKPEAGQKPEDVKIKVLTDGVENDFTMWLYAPDVTQNKGQFFEGQFEDGKSYFAGVSLTPTNGKVFDDKVEVILNGKKVEQDDLDNSVTYLMVTYGPFTIGEVDKQGEIESNAGGVGSSIESPKTGDGTRIMPLVITMVLSAAVIVVLPLYKKRREY